MIWLNAGKVEPNSKSLANRSTASGAVPLRVNASRSSSSKRARSSLVTVGRLSARNRLILEAAGQGSYGFDRHGKTTFVNQMAAEMLGWQAEELLGQQHHHLVHHTRPDGSHEIRLSIVPKGS